MTGEPLDELELAALAAMSTAAKQQEELMDERILVEMESLHDPVLHRKLALLTNAFASADEAGGIPPSDQSLDIRRRRYRYHAITAVAVARLQPKWEAR